MKKTILTSLALLAFTLSSLAQTPKQVKRAHKYVTKLNAYITNVNKDLALTEKQTKAITAAQIQRIIEQDKLKENVADVAKRKELNKPINDKYGKKINKEILSKEQFVAFKAGRKKAKANK